MNKRYTIMTIFLVISIIGYLFVQNSNKENFKPLKTSTYKDEKKASISKEEIPTPPLKKDLRQQENTPQIIDDVKKQFEQENIVLSPTEFEPAINTKGIQKSPLEIEFIKGFKSIPTEKEKAKYIVKSVFERKQDPEWSEYAQQQLISMADNLKDKYNLDYQVTGVRCSDVMCFVGLSGDFSIPKLEILEKFYQPISDTGLFKTTNLFVNDNFEKYSGLYLHRFNVFSNN